MTTEKKKFYSIIFAENSWKTSIIVHEIVQKHQKIVKFDPWKETKIHHFLPKISKSEWRFDLFQGIIISLYKGLHWRFLFVYLTEKNSKERCIICAKCMSRSGEKNFWTLHRALIQPSTECGGPTLRLNNFAKIAPFLKVLTGLIRAEKTKKI